jgi:hypothetical protein
LSLIEQIVLSIGPDDMVNQNHERFYHIELYSMTNGCNYRGWVVVSFFTLMVGLAMAGKPPLFSYKHYDPYQWRLFSKLSILLFDLLSHVRDLVCLSNKWRLVLVGCSIEHT